MATKKYETHQEYLDTCLCPNCEGGNLQSTDGEKYFHCPDCNYSGSDLEITDWKD